VEASLLAEFFSKMGVRIIKTQSCWWYRHKRFFFKSIPMHRLVTPSQKELDKVLLAGPAIAVRYPEPGVSTDWGMYVCDDRDYRLEHLPSPNARSHTRRGLARCRVERLDFHFLGEHGHPIGVDTNIRQNGLPPKETAESWVGHCSMFARYPGFEAWGAFVGNKLVAYIVAVLVEDCYYLDLCKSLTAYLGLYVNNAILFEATRDALSRPEIRCVSHGARGMVNSDRQHRFKSGMGFKLVPHVERVVFNPLLKPLTAMQPLLGWMAGRQPNSLFWQRAAKSLTMVAAGQP
jgi:hypothetical protein